MEKKYLKNRHRADINVLNYNNACFNLKGYEIPTTRNYASEPTQLGSVAGVNLIGCAMIKPHPGETCLLIQVISMPGKFNELIT